MSFWKKAKKTLQFGSGVAKVASHMMGHMPGKLGAMARTVAPMASTMHKMVN
jgi:hypothetical protein